MKILTVVGARPQFIKLAPVSKGIRKHFNEIIVHTGQHYDIEMSEIFFKQLRIPKPDYNLDVGSFDKASKQVKEIIKKLEKVIIKEKPDFVLVYGDTNSTLAGAICALKLKIPVAHIEAGMRSYNKMNEETNRVITDHVSNLFFCSTKTSVDNLEKEGITKNVFLVGDVMIDALMQNIKLANSKILSELNLKKKEYILSTIHRAENTDHKKRLKSIIESFIESDENIILPLHPRTKKYLKKFNLYNLLENSKVKIIKPVSYLDMLVLQKNSKKIITDSGGIQKEAYFFNVPCITLREVTEWTETIEEKANILVDADKEKIKKAIKNFEIKDKNKEIYGNGDSSKKIVSKIKQFLNLV